MAAETDPTKPLQPLDLIFSCNICHESIRDISSPVQETRELEGARKPAAKLWMTECAHLICAKHLEGGAPPFHPAGQAPRAVCPVCVNRQNNRALKQMYAISGFNKGQYDSEIPHHFFQCPPVALDTKDAGMDALRFQFLGLVTFGIAVATKFRNLQMTHSYLKDQTDKLRLEKAEAETEIQALTDRITLAEDKERKYKAKEPEIKHYLEKFALAKKELDLRNEELRRLGYHPPQNDYSFPPSRLLEDDTSTRRMPTSQTRCSDRERADQRIVEDYLPSVSSTTLRDTEDDPQITENKRRKLDEYRYEPHNTQSPSKGPSAQKRSGWRPPPASSITRSIPSKSKHFQPPPPMPHRSDNPQPTPGIENNDTDGGLQMSNAQHDNWGSWDRTENAHNPAPRSDNPPYMSGALQPEDLSFSPSAPFKRYQQQQRRIQPVDSIDDISRSGFITSGPPPTHTTPGQRYSTGGDIAYDPRSVFREPQGSPINTRCLLKAQVRTTVNINRLSDCLLKVS
ncbi:hypothetical protein E4T44_07243 [Aureobasidium sp. EXF-8845]|nr:hypothetical protein E4T44_07243 [Aureobasidium sp. EXF-8845]KAI4849352.1 hypothetical protein E4T45_05947 [Aureobasidium sp. EXF-8846]